MSSIDVYDMVGDKINAPPLGSMFRVLKSAEPLGGMEIIKKMRQK